MRDVGRGSGMEERSLEIGKCCEGEEGDDGDRKHVYTYFRKRFAKVYLVCLIMSLSWRQTCVTHIVRFICSL